MDKKGIVKEFFKGDKKRIAAVVLLVAGLLLMLFSSKVGSTESAAEDSLSKYKRELEKDLSELCSSIDGVGRCEVRITFSEGERVEYRGTNKVSETPPKVLGVSIVCDGGGRADVRAAITECMVALFDIGANRVAVARRS